MSATTDLARPVRAAQPPRTSAPRQRSGVARMLRMIRFELGMIVRQKVALMSVLLAPATAIGIAAARKPTDDVGWLVMLASMSMLVLILAVYTTTTSTVVSRRESQVLKRFRTSELLPRQMLIALAAPYVLVGLAQVLVLAIAYQQMGAPPVLASPGFWLVIAATTVMSVLAGFATASMTTSSERVQFGVMPLMMTGLVTSILVLNPGMDDAVRGGSLLAPYASSSDLVARLLTDRPIPPPGFLADLADTVGVSTQHLMIGLDSALIVAWSLVFALAARATWRWEPRG